jgi:hypothetical protein
VNSTLFARRLLAESPRWLARGSWPVAWRRMMSACSRWNSVATMLALPMRIVVLGPVSGARFNPVLSPADWWLGGRSRTGGSGRQLTAFVAVQGAVPSAAGCSRTSCSTCQPPPGPNTRASESGRGRARSLATAGLVLVIFA